MALGRSQDEAIEELRDQLRAAREPQTALGNSPICSSQGSRAAERRIKAPQGFFGVLEVLESPYRRKIDADHRIIEAIAR